MLPNPASTPHRSSAGPSAGSSINITDFTIRIPDSGARQAGPTGASQVTDRTKARRVAGDGSVPVIEAEARSRWATLEFRIYAAIFALVVPMMVWWPMRLSSGE